MVKHGVATPRCTSEVNHLAPTTGYPPSQEGTRRPPALVHRTYNDTKSKGNLPLCRTSSTKKQKTGMNQGICEGEANSTTVP